MSRATTKPAPQMAYITIGHSDFLLDASKAMKVAELMQHAFDCDKSYEDRGYVYTPTDQPRVEFALVRANQVRAPKPPTMPSKQRLLTLSTPPSSPSLAY